MRDTKDVSGPQLCVALTPLRGRGGTAACQGGAGLSQAEEASKCDTRGQRVRTRGFDDE